MALSTKRYNYRSRAKKLPEATERFAFHLTPEQDGWLDHTSLRLGLSKAHLLRSLIEEAKKRLVD